MFKTAILKSLGVNQIIANAIKQNNDENAQNDKKKLDALKIYINSTIMASNTDIEDKLNDKLQSISDSIDTVGDLLDQFTTKIKVITSQQEQNNKNIAEQLVIVSSKLSKELTIANKSILAIKSDVDESRTRLDAFIDVISEKLADLDKKRIQTRQISLEKPVQTRSTSLVAERTAERKQSIKPVERSIQPIRRIPKEELKDE